MSSANICQRSGCTAAAVCATLVGPLVGALPGPSGAVVGAAAPGVPAAVAAALGAFATVALEGAPGSVIASFDDAPWPGLGVATPVGEAGEPAGTGAVLGDSIVVPGDEVVLAVDAPGPAGPVAVESFGASLAGAAGGTSVFAGSVAARFCLASSPANMR